nr:MAG TPA: hypothetical protein [Bacteriophage sp.]
MARAAIYKSLLFIFFLLAMKYRIRSRRTRR